MKVTALLLLIGIGGIVPVPAQASIQELRQSAETGNAESEFQLGKAYLYGQGVPKDTAKALEFMTRSADQRYPDAVGALGYFYMTGTGVPLDSEKAISYFRKGAELGSAKAKLNLGLCLLGEQGASAVPASADADATTKEGLDLVRQAADEKLPEAAARLGRYYYFGGHGLAKDNNLAMPWLELAANAGDAPSQNILGVIHEKELTGALDNQAAEAWYRKAAMQGDGKAQANLGSLLAHNDRESEDRIESIAWLMVSRNGGEITATKTLENIDGIITPEDKVAATKMSKKLDADIRKNLRRSRSRSN